MCWDAPADDRDTERPAFTLALLEDLAELLARHGYPAPKDAVLADLTYALYRALDPPRNFGGG